MCNISRGYDEETLKKREHTFRRVEFLIDKALEEARFYWLRTNIFLVLHGGMFAFTAPRAFGTDAIPPYGILGISVVGIVLAVIWLFINSESRYLYQRWYADARHIIRNTPEMHEVFRHSLFGRSREFRKFGWRVEDRFDKYPVKFNATHWMAVLAFLFGIIWIYLVCYALKSSRGI